MKPTILFVHGALSTQRSFNFIQSQLLVQEQLDNPELFNYQRTGNAADFRSKMKYTHKNFSYDIRTEQGEGMVTRLVDYARPMCKAPMLIVCHSFGGVLGVAAARQLLAALPNAKISIVSMSTPYGGSALASFLKVLKPNSTFFKNIGAYDHFMRDFMAYPLPCKTTGIITTEGSADWMRAPNDGVVTVESQLCFKRDPKFIPISLKLNHFEVLMSERVVACIKKELL